ncbi:GTP cyclohydrolase 1 [Planctomycetes bacterium Poly30]|uniref:GTP cyclohydrolase 1 n=1 Tax=Saltatorellus ferox TaxID=2528018 RepID=A0A518EYB9_9BACT|nr:GTP cyclohydrolase 1 [Planctomycetes bacterium Poly30]
MTLQSIPRSLQAERAPVTREEALKSVRTLLRYMGEDPEREGLLDTPKRFLKAWDDLFSGYRTDPREALERTFEEVAGYDEIVILRGTEFYSHCEHHVIPMKGTVDIAYLPNGRVVGLSKLSRVVEGYAKRLQTQEALTAEIGDAIEEVLRPRGVAVIVRAQHQCMAMRGVRQCGADTVTQTLRGAFRTDPVEEARLFRLLDA